MGMALLRARALVGKGAVYNSTAKMGCKYASFSGGADVCNSTKFIHEVVWGGISF